MVKVVNYTTVKHKEMDIYTEQNQTLKNAGNKRCCSQGQKEPKGQWMLLWTPGCNQWVEKCQRSLSFSAYIAEEKPQAFCF